MTEKKVQKYRGTGLILEGGATRGVFTAGVLDYLMEQNLYLPYTVGVSAGACNAVDYAARQIGRTRDCMIHKGKENGYINLKSAVKNKSLFDMDMVFDKYPNEIFPFDYETYFDTDMECELVVTNCITGQAEYLNEKNDRQRLMSICRASSSMPLVGPMTMVDGNPYLDGGIADSIPIIHALKRGYKKDVVILTRNKGYRKKPIKKSRPLYMAAYKRYPEFVKTMFGRAALYNKTLSYIEKWEREGKIYVIRPLEKTVSRTEQNYEILMDFYNHGYEVMKQSMDGLLKYLEK